MDPNDLPRLVYLVLLLAVVGGYFIVESRGRLGKSAQQAAIWGLIFLGAVAAAGLWGDVRRAVLPGEAVVRGDALEVPVSEDGHYYLSAEVNGAKVLFVVDTGASDIVLAQRDAERAGLDPAGLAYFGTAMTANGRVATAPVTLDRFAVGGVEERGVPAVVNGGDLDTSLLGMSWLGGHEATFSRDRLVIRR
ncbi:TIGR02281 family clan AA aspartic protease [Albidovulum sp.]|uniref:retropepsin-like aspartic protease family protein n=1 Tax=Albidovulum sp. TaxID=1872424 RepID=UPI0039B9C04B